MLKCVIFDFDHTLFDSRILDNLRKQRKWAEVYEQQIACDFHDGAEEFVENLSSWKIKTAIVSNAPKTYINKVLASRHIKIDLIVAYHDVINHKPSPDGIYLVIKKFLFSNNEVIYIGDNDIDALTAKNANVCFYGVEWGTFSDPTTVKYDFKKLNDLVNANNSIQG